MKIRTGIKVKNNISDVFHTKPFKNPKYYSTVLPQRPKKNHCKVTLCSVLRKLFKIFTLL